VGDAVADLAVLVTVGFLGEELTIDFLETAMGLTSRLKWIQVTFEVSATCMPKLARNQENF
jgi:hypothetical protein